MKPDLSTHITPLTDAIQKLGVTHTIYTLNSETTEYNGMEIHKIPMERPFSFFRTGLSFCKQFKVVNDDTDIIHFHNPRFVSMLLKKKQLPAIVMTVHDSPTNLLKTINWNNKTNIKQTLYFYFLTRWAAKKVDAFICVSSEIRDDLIKRWGLNPEKVYVVPSAVDNKIFYPLNTKREIDLLFVARFVEKKRPLDFVRIVNLLVKTNPHIRAVMVGANKKDPLYDVVVAETQSGNLNHNITLVGEVTQNELRQFYNKSKLFVLPSVSEGASKVCLESMACGTPVLATDIVGNRNIIIDGRTGYLLHPKDINGFVNKIEYLLSNEIVRVDMGNNAYNQSKRYTWDASAKEQVRIYKSLVRK
jgi:glycosyltransferase involved in cell wall biosynthesis